MKLSQKFNQFIQNFSMGESDYEASLEIFLEIKKMEDQNKSLEEEVMNYRWEKFPDRMGGM